LLQQNKENNFDKEDETLRRESVEEMSSDDSATADRVEKKSIDEAIASFAMLVRRICVYFMRLCAHASGRRGGLGNRFFCFFFSLLSSSVMMMMMMMFCV
jgi:hypothetical protein